MTGCQFFLKSFCLSQKFSFIPLNKLFVVYSFSESTWLSFCKFKFLDLQKEQGNACSDQKYLAGVDWGKWFQWSEQWTALISPQTGDKGLRLRSITVPWVDLGVTCLDFETGNHTSLQWGEWFFLVPGSHGRSWSYKSYAFAQWSLDWLAVCFWKHRSFLKSSWQIFRGLKLDFPRRRGSHKTESFLPIILQNWWSCLLTLLASHSRKLLWGHFFCGSVAIHQSLRSLRSCGVESFGDCFQVLDVSSVKQTF